MKRRCLPLVAVGIYNLFCCGCAKQEAPPPDYTDWEKIERKVFDLTGAYPAMSAIVSDSEITQQMVSHAHSFKECQHLDSIQYFVRNNCESDATQELLRYEKCSTYLKLYPGGNTPTIIADSLWRRCAARKLGCNVYLSMFPSGQNAKDAERNSAERVKEVQQHCRADRAMSPVINITWPVDVKARIFLSVPACRDRILDQALNLVGSGSQSINSGQLANSTWKACFDVKNYVTDESPQCQEVKLGVELSSYVFPVGQLTIRTHGPRDSLLGTSCKIATINSSLDVRTPYTTTLEYGYQTRDTPNTAVLLEGEYALSCDVKMKFATGHWEAHGLQEFDVKVLRNDTTSVWFRERDTRIEKEIRYRSSDIHGW